VTMTNVEVRGREDAVSELADQNRPW